MIKRICDICKKEIERNCVGQRYLPCLGKVSCEVMVAIEGTWNDGEICLDCLKKVLMQGKEKK